MSKNEFNIVVFFIFEFSILCFRLDKCKDVVIDLVRQKKRSLDSFYSRKNVEIALNCLRDMEFEQYVTIPPEPSNEMLSIDKVICTSASIFIGGKIKFKNFLFWKIRKFYHDNL